MDFDGWEISAESKELYRQSPDAFLMAAILSKQIRGPQAYEIPFRLKQRMGHLDVRRIAKMRREELARLHGPGQTRAKPCTVSIIRCRTS